MPPFVAKENFVTTLLILVTLWPLGAVGSCAADEPAGAPSLFYLLLASFENLSVVSFDRL